MNVVAKADNTVIINSDPSAHAEMNAIRALTNKNKSPILCKAIFMLVENLAQCVRQLVFGQELMKL